MMNPLVKKRFGDIWRLTNNVSPTDIAISNPMLCTKADAEQAVSNGLAVQLPKGTPITCNAFSVLETKLNPKRIRRRPIQWAKRFNEMCEEKGYKAQVDLKHHSNYFQRCNNQTGATFDLKAGFFQVPLSSPNLFTFADEEGNIFGLKRLPMGICTAPEIMQLITSAIAGDPTIVQPKFAVKAVVDVWIDNVLFSGSSEKVSAAVANFKRVTTKTKTTINWHEAEEGSSLDFIGMHYDFQAHTIGMSNKNRSKIVDMSFASNMLMSELETNTARLMYASSVMAVPLSSYYFALKFIRRKLSEINRETITRNDMVHVSPSALKAFTNWKRDVLLRNARTLPSEEGRRTFTLWTDASNIGWGAVLIDNLTQQVRIVADKWSEEDALSHINILEAKAVRYALERFEGIEGSVIQPRIDNTSVVWSVAKGYSRSQDINEEIATVQRICNDKGILLKAPIYVRSKDNIADEWSRYFD